MIVMKFGGSSVKDAVMFKTVVSIVKSKLSKKPVVVLSAVKGMTDALILAYNEAPLGKFDSYNKIVENHKKIISDLGVSSDIVKPELDELKEALDVISKTKERSAQLLDYISFFGERMSTKIFADYITREGIAAEAFVSGDIGLITDSHFGDASILESSFSKMKKEIAKIKVLPVITGFGGKDANGEYTTFNRGGSDYVASLIGAAIDAEVIEIWTDVNGVMSTDPRIVPNAKTIPELSFDEASELAYFGAKVLHPKAILPAIQKGIPVLVLNTFEPSHPGTRIVKEQKDASGRMKSISYKKGISIIDVKSTRMIDTYGYISQIFSVFDKYKKSVDMISTSEINVSVTVDSKENVDSIANELKNISEVNVVHGKAIVYVVGASMQRKIGTVGMIMDILAHNKINVDMISQCYDDVSVGFVVDEKDAETVVKILHEELID
jgi:aspartate kinase